MSYIAAGDEIVKIIATIYPARTTDSGRRPPQGCENSIDRCADRPQGGVLNYCPHSIREADIKHSRGSFENMKQINVSLALRIIRDHAPVSRARIAEISGLTPASVTNITQHLMEKELIVECGTSESNGGRPAVNLKLNPAAYYIFGICFAPSAIEIILTDFTSGIVSERTVTAPSTTPADIIDLTADCIEQIMAQKKIRKKELLGIGVAINGIVDIEQGVSVFAPHYKWHNINIKQMLESRMKINVLIENDTNAMAIAERWFGAMHGCETKNAADECFIALNMGNGVGAGIMMNDKVYHGNNYAAGEIGHIVIDESGPRCSCGKRGCLETLVSSSALVKKALALTPAAAKVNSASVAEKTPDISMITICERAKNGDLSLREIITRAGKDVGLALANMIATLNPSHIIIGGDIIESEELFFDAVRTTVRKETLEILHRPVEIQPSRLGRYRATIGAVAMVLADFFKGERLT